MAAPNDRAMLVVTGAQYTPGPARGGCHSLIAHERRIYDFTGLWGLWTGDARGLRDWGLGTGDWGLGTGDWGVES